MTAARRPSRRNPSPENRQEQAEIIRLPNGQFSPGHTGNAGGRLKTIADIRELAQEHSPAALAKLAHLVDNAKSETAQIEAAKAILDRGYGRATQPLAGDDSMGPLRLSQMSEAERQREAEARRNEAQRLLDDIFGEESVIAPNGAMQ